MPKWQVRPSLFLIAPATHDDVAIVARFIEADAAHDGKPGVGLAVGPLGGQALTTSLMIESSTAGEACDLGVEILRRACAASGLAGAASGLAVGDLQEVVVEPGWRDPRAW